MLLKSILFIFSLMMSSALLACLPNEIFIREQFINSYTKQDGTGVSAHIRHEHCREIEITNFFQDKTSQKFKNINPKIKPWTKKEKETIETYLSQLPPWLKKFPIQELLRANTDKDPRNPASTIVATRTMIIYDRFFQENVQKDVLIHEVAHISILDLSDKELIDFYTASGWIKAKQNNKNSINGFVPPTKVLIEDSVESVSEDYANNIEVYYSNPLKLKEHNLKSFQIIDEIIKSRSK